MGKPRERQLCSAREKEIPRSAPHYRPAPDAVLLDFDDVVC